jgi:DNA-binding NarL/FixJ family response regulator
VVRQGLIMALTLDPDIEVVGEAANGAAAVQMTRNLRPDVVVMDLMMPEMDGIAATAAIKSELPDIQVVALTTAMDDESIVGAVRAGAIGYLLKDTSSDEIRRAVRGAAEKQVQLSPIAAARLMQQVQTPAPPQALTVRETDVLRLVGQGHLNREIAASLDISEKTVSAHVTNILTKLGMQSRTQAAMYAVRTGLVPAGAAKNQS